MQSIDSVKNELTREVVQKLTASDAILKDNLTKLIRNRVSQFLLNLSKF